MAMIKRKGEIGSPCRTPFRIGVSSVGDPLTRIDVRLEFRYPRIHPCHFFLKPIWSMTDSRKFQLRESKSLEKSTLNMSICREDLFIQSCTSLTRMCPSKILLPLIKAVCSSPMIELRTFCTLVARSLPITFDMQPSRLIGLKSL